MEEEEEKKSLCRQTNTGGGGGGKGGGRGEEDNKIHESYLHTSYCISPPLLLKAETRQKSVLR